MTQEQKNEPKSPARRRFLQVAATGLVASVGTAAYAHDVEPNHPRVEEREIKLAGWPHSAAGMRIGQLSDFHCQDLPSVARTARAAQIMLAQKPDVVFLTGDYISHKPVNHWARACADALAPLTKVSGGVFAILGNHDWWGPHAVARHLRRVGFRVLRNQSSPLPHAPGVWIVGLDDRTVCVHDPNLALQGVPTEALKLLLVHEPDYADDAPPGFALQLSGHSHGGQIRLPGLPLHCPKYGQHYPEGLQQGPHHPVYTSRGVGMMGPQMRFCCPPEVTVLTLYPA